MTIFIFLTGLAKNALSQAQDTPPAARVGLLKLLGLTASPESIDYVQNKTQFQLHTLLTEQRHPRTWNLSERIQDNIADGLKMLFSVDEDIAKRLQELADEPQPLEPLVAALEEAVLSQRRVYIYGCGATGRLAKQIESSFWRPFWRGLKADEKTWPKLRPRLSPSIEEGLIGEMTGADRALISSLEGFEDLQLIGRLQLADRDVKKGDVVVCVTEGGETSSVIGTILAALDQWKEGDLYDPAETRRKLFFIYNNPDDKLLPFLRSRLVIEEPGITKINLTTGPQAITGSTRMQATTIETFVIGNCLQEAVCRVLARFLSKKELARIGFDDPLPLGKRLQAFSSIREEVKKNVPALSALTALEAATYAEGRFSTYFSARGMITVFIDSTERSPTFRLFPLDTVNEPRRKCWIQVWTPASDAEGAWRAFLGRPFRGLAPEFYQEHFEEEIDDPYLKTAALESLKRAGNDQQFLYDFSFSEASVKKRGPQKDDLGVLVLFSPEEEELEAQGSPWRAFAELFVRSGAGLALLVIGDRPSPKFFRGLPPNSPLIHLRLADKNDPFGVTRHIGLKMLLNAHSTAVMARLWRVIGNTMTNVSPSNLKLIGRATSLIQSHVNDVLSRPAWVSQRGTREPVSYGEANAVLFESINFLRDRMDTAGQTAEVALSIIRILESLRQSRGVSNEEALGIVQKNGLSAYLASVSR